MKPLLQRTCLLRLSITTAALFAVLAGISYAEAQAPAPSFSGGRAYQYASQFVNETGRRYVGSPGHQKAEAFIRQKFAQDQLIADDFTASTPAGIFAMRNFIVKFPGRKDGVIVVGTHYETNYPLKDINFVGANDGGATTGILVELANHLRGKTLEGYSVWLVFFDGEEAFQSWSASDSTYGSKHLAAKWSQDGTLPKIKAFLLADMIGDKDLDITREENSTPWLLDTVRNAATKLGYQRYFYETSQPVEDDQLPFVKRGVPVADIIDIDFGPHDASHPDGWHHTANDTLDKISPHSLQVSGQTILETIHLLNQR